MKFYAIFIVLLITIGMSGCHQAKQVLGFERTKNDEFEILTTDRLTLPKNYKKLPDPKGREENFSEKTRDHAKVLALAQLTYNNEEGALSMDSCERGILEKIRVSQRNPKIRQILDDEYNDEQYTAEAFVKRFLPIGKRQSGRVINPMAEKKRLEKDNSKDEK